MSVTNDQIDKLTEVCLDIAVRRTRAKRVATHQTTWQEVCAEFEAQIGMPLADVRARMSLGEFDEAYRRFCLAHGYQS